MREKRGKYASSQNHEMGASSCRLVMKKKCVTVFRSSSETKRGSKFVSCNSSTLPGAASQFMEAGTISGYWLQMFVYVPILLLLILQKDFL